MDYPTPGKPITFIVVAGTGGTVDNTARMLAPVMEKDLGVPIQVVNRAGGATLIGSSELMRAKPDGHTMGVLSLSSLTMGYLDPEKKDTGITGRKDFRTIGMTTIEPSVLVVQGGGPYKELKDLIAAAKANPNTVKAATTGLFGPNHLVGTALQKEANVQFSFAHFDGGGPAVTPLLGGHVDASLIMIGGSTSEHVRAGTLRMLAISGEKRSPYYPDLETYTEQGYKVNFLSPYAIALPAGTPKEIADVLSASLKRALENESVKKLAETKSMTLQYVDPAAADTYWASFESTEKELLDLAKKQSK